MIIISNEIITYKNLLETSLDLILSNNLIPNNFENFIFIKHYPKFINFEDFIS